MSVTYGKVDAECGCCLSPPVEFDSAEGRERRRRCAKNYKALSRVQLPVAILALGSGATSAGLSFLNPSYPYFLCFPVVSGVLMLIAGIFGSMAGKANMDNQVPPQAKRNVIVHYVLCVTGCTFCMLAASFSGTGLGYCLDSGGPTGENCTPHRDVRTAFAAADIVLGLLLFVTCIVGLVLFCRHARSLGFTNRLQRMESEVNTLRAQVASLSQAQQAQQFGRVGEAEPGVQPASFQSRPPAYSQVSPSGGGPQYGFSGSDFGGSGAGKGQWPAGY